ncbi:unnamed protein product [Adineta ricciae]|uniref:Uncharacterized protein n=2 Tax=Adineta ricciae TaxID=249248 RepID=A0A815H7N0_ADIRI|nr:unnamed protein product [Adineta ricciae]
MASLVEALSTVHLSKDVKTSPQTDVHHEQIQQLSPRVYGNVRRGDVIVIWLGRKESSLKNALIEYLVPRDITLVLLSIEEQLWCWLNTYSLLTVACLIIETSTTTSEEVACRCRTIPSIRSMLIRCCSHELTRLQRTLRSNTKIDGIFSDDTRLLIKLVIDVALFSEEIGDDHAENDNDEVNIRRNYDRALSLCALAKRL